jgi:putative nucleotidyltransferase with HDIG domain
MRSRTRWYVAALILAAAVWALVLYRYDASSASPVIGNALVLTALAIAAEMLSFLLPRSAAGSMAFIPYFAAAVILPRWPTVIAVAAVRALLELVARREVVKGLFNVSAHALMELTAISVYVALGGVSLLLIPARDLADLTQVTRVAGLPALVAFIAALLINNALVAVAIGLSTARSIWHVWLENHRSTIGIDLMATPIVFLFAWVYAAFGPIAAAALWVPILGLRQIHKTNLELEQTNEELLQLMVKSLEARDPYTSGHSRRVQHYSATIARAIGLGERAIRQVSKAALLHDVGKIYEKYAAVLAKADKLTPDEWAIIQDHPADGANLVATMSKLRDVVPAIRHHHENWDGTGYPDRLAGDLIPIASRIIRFADTIDAMTTERPYRRPLGQAEVRAEVVRCRGSQFDPGIADRLLSSSLWPSLFSSPAIGIAEQDRSSVAAISVGSSIRKLPSRGAREA